MIGRVDKTPDWIVASASQDLCNQEPYFTEMNQEWKLGDYQDLLLLDVGKNFCGEKVILCIVCSETSMTKSGNLILRLRKVGARLGQGWGKVGVRLG